MCKVDWQAWQTDRHQSEQGLPHPVELRVPLRLLPHPQDGDHDVDDHPLWPRPLARPGASLEKQGHASYQTAHFSGIFGAQSNILGVSQFSFLSYIHIYLGQSPRVASRVEFGSFLVVIGQHMPNSAENWVRNLHNIAKPNRDTSLCDHKLLWTWNHINLSTADLQYPAWKFETFLT